MSLRENQEAIRRVFLERAPDEETYPVIDALEPRTLGQRFGLNLKSNVLVKPAALAFVGQGTDTLALPFAQDPKHFRTYAQWMNHYLIAANIHKMASDHEKLTARYVSAYMMLGRAGRIACGLFEYRANIHTIFALDDHEVAAVQ